MSDESTRACRFGDDLDTRQTAYNIDAETGGWSVVRGAELTASTFAVLRVAPLLGRPILPADEAPGGDMAPAPTVYLVTRFPERSDGLAA